MQRIKEINLNRNYFFIISLFFLVFGCKNSDIPSFPVITNLDDSKQIETYIKKQMRKGKIPGLALVVVKNDRIAYMNCFGYSDIEMKKNITPDTLFELGSNSKAFTGLALLSLSQKGLVNLNDPVRKYLPWLIFKYDGNETDVTLEQFLHQTSGVPSNTINKIATGNEPDSLEKTVRNLIGLELKHIPGSTFAYATINYDVLGLVIQKVTGMPFEDYILENEIKPLNLHDTFLFKTDDVMKKMARGYKPEYLRNTPYDAPVYRGNTPAGYYMTDIKDLGNWINIQLGDKSIPEYWQKLIEESHIPNRTVAPSRDDGSSYAVGWFSYQVGNGELTHGGMNPNFSSFIIMRPGDKIGVGVLSNINSDYARFTAQGVLSILYGEKPSEPNGDQMLLLDKLSSGVICFAVPLILIVIVLLIISIMQIILKKRKPVKTGIRFFFIISIFIIFSTVIVNCLFKFTELFANEMTWDVAGIWIPGSTVTAVYSILTLVIMFQSYFLLIYKFRKKNEINIFPLLITGFASGFGNAIIIFVVNQAINSDNAVNYNLGIYFLLGLMIYIFSQKFVRTKLISFTNNLVFDKRIILIDKILNSPFQDLENVDNGRIQAGLNNDPETVSHVMNSLISAATHIITLTCGLLYMGIINLYALIITLAVAVIAAGMYIVVIGAAQKIWEQTRDIQNVFFKFINDMLGGFKELSLNKKRKYEFRKDVHESCDTYRKKRIEADLKVANVFLTGELMFTCTLGVVVFLFPFIFKDMQMSTMRIFIFIFLFLVGPINVILSAIPNIAQIRIAWKRMGDIAKDLTGMEHADNKESEMSQTSGICISLSDVEFNYNYHNDSKFCIGPVNCSFNDTEIVFITGGNGSGKSTLAKLIAGLYSPDKGVIRLNGKMMNRGELGEYFSAVFSDFYLFEKPYGMDYLSKINEVHKYIEKVRIGDKVRIEGGKFSTIRLSSGQKKRLALVLSYMEDRPVFLFDEWAADQDPEFKMFFYNELLPELKSKGKCVIAITHDDRYFHLADRIIKMDMGKISEIIDCSKTYRYAKDVQ
jgi:putative pyoverdin transport system ATP-binding/permease protein